MMDVRELRIGNYVYLSRSTTPSKITEIGFSEIEEGRYEVGGISTESAFRAYVDNLNPIPVTDDLLLRCGFKCVGAELDGEIVQQFVQSGLKNVCLGRNNEGIYLCTLYNNGYAEIDSLSQVKKILYFHQLQNIYFDLSGKELEIKLD